jgi:hypothetical protein
MNLTSIEILLVIDYRNSISVQEFHIWQRCWKMENTPVGVDQKYGRSGLPMSCQGMRGVVALSTVSCTQQHMPYNTNQR